MSFSAVPTRANGQKADASWWNLLQVAGSAVESSIATLQTTVAAVQAGSATLQQNLLSLLSSSPSAPSSGTLLFYAKADGNLYTKNSAGVESKVGSGGGGGGGLEWIEDVNSPVPVIDQNAWVYSFAPAAAQTLYCTLKIPSTYTSGGALKLRLAHYSPDSSGTNLMQTVATLIRSGIDPVSSTTNQRTSTNSAITLSAGTVSTPQLVTFDLSDTVGKINSVAASAGDLVKVALTRGTDTGSSNVLVLIWSSEVTFQ